ncbi:MAG: DUF4159 domain-containing protein [Phycisphaeraceae bacterium]
MNVNRLLPFACLLLAVAILASLLHLAVAAEEGAAAPTTQPVEATADEAREGQVQVARWTYDKDKSGVCFSDGFLAEVARRTDIKVHRKFVDVRLDSADLYNYPFAVMSGEGEFTLTDVQRQHLKAYLDRGGFVLASAGCTSQPWAMSFRREISQLYPDAKLVPLPPDHAIFTKGVFEIDRLMPRSETSEAMIYGLEIGGKLRLVFSPVGLNDTANAGGGCCCCGGNEIRNAKYVNANLLVYALTH